MRFVMLDTKEITDYTPRDWTDALASFLGNVKPSATIGLIKKKQQLEAEFKAKGSSQKIYSFTAGELDFPVPKHIVDAIIAAAEKMKYKYTGVSGTEGLKKAIQAKLLRDNGLSYETNQIIVTAGAKEALAETLRVLIRAPNESLLTHIKRSFSNAAKQVLGRKDQIQDHPQREQVLIGGISWVSYKAMIQIAGGEPIPVEMDAETFKWTPEILRKALKKNKNVKAVMFNSPNNPTGAVYSRQELEALGHVLKDYPGVFVISDDIYEHIRYPNKELDSNESSFATMAQIDGFKDRTITINGGSKAYALTGLRVGYAAGPKPIIEGIETLQGHSSGNATVLSQEALLAALDPDLQGFLKDWINDLKKNRDLTVSKLNDMGLKCSAPEGAFYVFASIDDLIGRETQEGTVLQNAQDVADYFLEKYYVMVVPGEDFGSDKHIRISFATNCKDMGEGLDLMAKAIKELKPAPEATVNKKTNMDGPGKGSIHTPSVVTCIF